MKHKQKLGTKKKERVMSKEDSGNVIEYHGKLFVQGRIKSEYGNCLISDSPESVIREAVRVLKDRKLAEKIMKLVAPKKGRKQPKPVMWHGKEYKRFPWKDVTIAQFSISKASEGGMGYTTAKSLLEDAGIPCRKGYSPYVGQIGIDVPMVCRNEADKILLG